MLPRPDEVTSDVRGDGVCTAVEPACPLTPGSGLSRGCMRMASDDRRKYPNQAAHPEGPRVRRTIERTVPTAIDAAFTDAACAPLASLVATDEF